MQVMSSKKFIFFPHLLCSHFSEQRKQTRGAASPCRAGDVSGFGLSFQLSNLELLFLTTDGFAQPVSGPKAAAGCCCVLRTSLI